MNITSVQRNLGKIHSADLTIEDTNNPYIVVSMTGEGWGTCAHETPVNFMKYMRDAGRARLSNMKNVPVEVCFVDNRLHSWRILTEVM